jgi:hypothetical protein
MDVLFWAAQQKWVLTGIVELRLDKGIAPNFTANTQTGK